MNWIDTHCHLDAAAFDADRDTLRQTARAEGVGLCLYPAVQTQDFARIQQLAAQHHDVYALGIHPCLTPSASTTDLALLDQALGASAQDPRLVAVGEIGLDGFVPALTTPQGWQHQNHLYLAQLKLAQRHGLPVVLHVRKSADAVLKGLRHTPVAGGIAHAFNGSLQQANAFLEMGFKLGFGGALTYARALHLRQLAAHLPLSALVLETDAPDMPPQWLYTPQAQRLTGQPQGRNAPSQLARIAQVLADLRGIPLQQLAQATSTNADQALPRLAAWRSLQRQATP